MHLINRLIAGALLAISAVPAAAQTTFYSTDAHFHTVTTLGTVTSGTWNATPISNAFLANSAVIVNGTSCTLGAACAPTAIASSVVPGTTTVTGGTSNGLLYNNGGGLGNLATANSGVLITTGSGVPYVGTAAQAQPVLGSTLLPHVANNAALIALSPGIVPTPHKASYSMGQQLYEQRCI
jgi:hypothetical protein